jgi:hypothetical protein
MQRLAKVAHGDEAKLKRILQLQLHNLWQKTEDFLWKA